MPPPETTVQLFGGAAGTHEGLGPLDVAEFFSSEDSSNVYIDKSGPLGRIRKILGYLAQNSAITTDTGASATKVVGLLPYKKHSGGTTTREVLAVVDDGVNEFEVHKSADSAATFSFLKELGTTPGLIPDGAQMDNDLFITDGAGVPQKYNGTSVTDAADATASPTPSASSTGTGPLRGVYEYKIVSLKAGRDQQRGSAVSAELRIDSDDGTKAAVSWTADADGDVVGYELYRTTGTGLAFYKLAYIEGRTNVTFTDSVSDENLLQGITLEKHGDIPPTGVRYVEAHQQRMWWAGTNAFPRRAWYSDPGDAASVYVADNYLEFTDATSASDEIKGMTGGFTDANVFWQEFSVWAASGTGEVVNNVANWTRWKTSASVGTVSHRTVAEIPAGALYPGPDGRMRSTSSVTLAYFTPWKTVNLLFAEGGDFSDEIISHAKEDFLADVQFQYRHLIVVEHDEVRGHVRWYFPHGAGQTTNNKGVLWDYRHGKFSEISTAPFACAATIQKADQAQMLLVGEATTGTGGLVYENWSGNNYNGVGNNIAADFWTKTYSGSDEEGRPLIEKRKQWHWVQIIAGAQASTQNLTLRWYDGYGNASATARGSNAAIDMAGTNVTNVSNREDLLDSSGDMMTSESIRIRIGDDSDDPAWSVPVFALAFKILPGLMER